MAEINPPYALQGGTVNHPALLFRRAIAALVSEGVNSFNTAGDLKVTQNSTPGMSVFAQRGGAFVQGDDATDQGVYFVYNDATVTLTAPASDATNPRLDIVVAHVKDNFHGQAGDTWLLEYIAGTPAGSPVAPATPNTALKLATVSVAALSTTILNAAITDNRTKVPVTPRVRVHRSVDSGNVATGVTDIINWDVKDYDTHGFFTSGTNFVVPAGLAGFYSILGCSSWAQATGLRIAQILINGAIRGYSTSTGVATVQNRLQVASQWPLNDGDTVSLQVRQDSGGNLVESGGISECFLGMVREGG